MTPHSAIDRPGLGARLEAMLHKAWQRRGPGARVLWPLAALHDALWRLRRLAYARGWCRTHGSPVPVIVVGNVVVGGTGKTPLLIALSQGLHDFGWTPGVISRGYGAQGPIKTPRVGRAPLDPLAFGDEPSLIAQATGVPVAVHPRRIEAVRALCRAHPEVDVILADDGLQHLALGRQIDLVVQDARGVGNGWLLPAGPLREPADRLRRVAGLITNLAPGDPLPHPAPPGVRATVMRLQPGMAVRLIDGAQVALQALPAQRGIAAVAGIGQPQRFFQTLRAAGVPLTVCRALPDHASFAGEPFAGLDADIILLTDKDAVKCQGRNDPRLWRVPVTAQLDDPDFFDWLHQRLRACPPVTPLPSAHGSTPA
ncbi:MAG: tetraacyldisaccharide 4'-kinase [Pigmentiphaga sp.]